MLKYTLLSALTAISLLAGSTACPTHYLNGQAPDIVNQKLSTKTRELCFEGFVVMHSGVTKTPIWSAEHLTKDKIAAKLQRKDMFHPESRLPANERAELSDYAKTGYDRGHMTPSADMGTEATQAESFSLANMVPQDHNNNTKIWAAIEKETRQLATKEGDEYIITGPLFKGDKPKAIGKNNVLVPTQVYKIVYSPKQQKGAAYLCDNTSNVNCKVISISELEGMSGINYFPKLSKAQKDNKLELVLPTVGK
jgi:endonuclease G